MSRLYIQENDEWSLSILIEATERRVPEALESLSQVPETSTDIKARKNALLGMWRRYHKAVGLENEYILSESKKLPVNVPPWTTWIGGKAGTQIGAVVTNM
ncbi:hypothetical protein EIP86_002394 [Pleurotus ostreatoroseus]|nr:hypothetical protein EIP86_002394 [Pleurotus ostreatoroseus]